MSSTQSSATAAATQALVSPILVPALGPYSSMWLGERARIFAPDSVRLPA